MSKKIIVAKKDKEQDINMIMVKNKDDNKCDSIENLNINKLELNTKVNETEIIKLVYDVESFSYIDGKIIINIKADSKVEATRINI